MGAKRQESVKNVTFDFLQAKYTSFHDQNGSAGMQTYKLETLFSKISSVDLPRTRKIVNGDPYMFHICKYHPDCRLWEIQILHFREKMLPGIGDDFGGYEPIKLKDFEYPAESSTLVYDEEKCILYMQKNKFALSIRNLEAYFSQLSPEGTAVYLAIVNNGENIKKVTPSCRYRNVVLTVDTRKAVRLEEASSLRQILDVFKPYEGAYISIKIRTPRTVGSILNGKTIDNLIRDAYEYDGTSKLETDMADPDDLEFETIDLLDNHSRIVIPFGYSRKNPITHERLFAACKAEIKK